MQKINKTDSIFIAGQSGMVGSAITRKLKENGYQNLLVPSRKTLDLLDYKSTENWFKNQTKSYPLSWYLSSLAFGIIKNFTEIKTNI